MIEATVGHLLRGSGSDQEILLGMRDKTLFFNAVWNGPGGKKRKSETIFGCLKRELREEIGVVIDPLATKHFASIDFYNPFGDRDKLTWRVHYLSVTKWEGEPRPIQKLKELRWFPCVSLPYGQMMADQIAWLPLSLSPHGQNGMLLKAEIYYGDEESKTLKTGSFCFVERANKKRAK